MKEARDRWMAATRVSVRLGAEWEAAARVQLDPRYVPVEAVTPTNLSFTTIDSALGLRWSSPAGRKVTVTYGFVYVVPIHVERSIYSPRAPSDSGLSLPSARGEYRAVAHRLVVGFDGFWH